MMLLSTRIIDLETKHRIDLEVCSERYEKSQAELRQRVEMTERRNLELEEELRELKKKLEIN